MCELLDRQIGPTSRPDKNVCPTNKLPLTAAAHFHTSLAVHFGRLSADVFVSTDKNFCRSDLSAFKSAGVNSA